MGLLCFSGERLSLHRVQKFLLCLWKFCGISNCSGLEVVVINFPVQTQHLSIFSSWLQWRLQRTFCQCLSHQFFLRGGGGVLTLEEFWAPELLDVIFIWLKWPIWCSEWKLEFSTNCFLTAQQLRDHKLHYRRVLTYGRDSVQWL